ncbi:hypothetical protein B0T10DRAFT_594349 [Thelonectria olida]|uniref:Uncharacterized protein n=1 Tax=Thelonectria olida TaxID=1576542 RepID=A0A9P8WAI9_9HYPO|nr:hypothetical protein B0T10DRAFT_594349 [Thelonectria olida]
MSYRSIPDFMPTQKSFPSAITGWLCAGLLVISLCLGVLAAHLPVHSMPFVFMVVLFLFVLPVVVVLALDWSRTRRTSPHGTWSPNLTNTATTILLALVVFPMLYKTTWHHQLNEQTLTLVEDSVEQIGFPSIALFQRLDWPSQTDLTTSAKPKCFVGWHDETAPPCSSALANTTCSCAQNWDLSIDPNFHWQGVSYKILSLKASKHLIIKPRRSRPSRASSPGLWVSFYDPALTISKTLQEGYARMHLIDANGEVAVNLGVTRREKPGEPPLYDYQLTFSSVLSMDLDCDISNGESEDVPVCFVSLLVQFHLFSRRTLRSGPALTWMV